MFTWDDPTIPSNAQVAFARKIQSVTGRKLPEDMSRMSMRAYISTNYPEFRRIQLDAVQRMDPDDLEWDAGLTDGEIMYGYDFLGIDLYTGGLAEY